MSVDRYSKHIPLESVRIEPAEGVVVASVLYFLRMNEYSQTEILLGQRNATNFANGLRNGPGGKMDDIDELSIYKTTARESQEECGVMPNSPQLIAAIRYPEVLDGKTMDVYFSADYVGQEFPELKPGRGMGNYEWFPVSRLPFGEMHQDNRIWLPRALGGRLVAAECVNTIIGQKSSTVIEPKSIAEFIVV